MVDPSAQPLFDRSSLILIVALILMASAAACTPAVGAGDPPVYAQSGDVTDRSAVLWARCNREQESRLVVRVSESPAIEAEPFSGPRVDSESDYTGSLIVEGLQPDTKHYYRIDCEGGGGDQGPLGSFKTAASAPEARPVRFVWAADIAGQGWGRNPELQILDIYGEEIVGGYLIFDVLRKLQPDFAIMAGDGIYADSPNPPGALIPLELGGGIYRNEPAKDFVAISLDAFRRNWRYNLGDPKLRRFLLATPTYHQWDDHEVTDNWYPGEILALAPYNGLPADTLARTSRRALYEYNAISSDKLFRKFRHGRHLEIFLLDVRSYRGPNPENSDPQGIEMLGQEQYSWLRQGLKQSQATWKVISTTDPLSLVTGLVGDHDGWAQDDAAVLGREVQLSRLLSFIKEEEIRNVLFITADVHFAAAISYDPARAVFKDFDPFWEFAIGPGHAGTFGPLELDRSFGPRFAYLRAPGTEGIPMNSPPPHLQSFGSVEVAEAGRLVVRLHDLTGEVLYERRFQPE